jgi:hypothetical protein
MSGHILFLFIMSIQICKLQSYDCIFGFSTGHVGTGTLNDQKSYKNTSHIEFFFEGTRISTSKTCNVKKRTYEDGFSAGNEDSFVSSKLAPFMNDAMTDIKKKILVDLGHADLFYYRGIARYFKNSNNSFCSNIHFLRIRRERYESAVSLMYVNPSRKKGDNMCRSIIFGYCPYQNTDSVLLTPPSRKRWESLNAFQQALWLIDETEARWQAFKKEMKASGITFSEIYWCSDCEDGNTMAQATAYVARLLKTIPVHTGNLPHQHVHAGQIQKNNDKELEQHKKDDLDYQKIMNYGYERR